MGVLGPADPADVIGLSEVEAGFGGTLAIRGVPEGGPLDRPGFGPSTERVVLGRAVDFAIDSLGSLDWVPREVADYVLPARIGEKVIERGRLRDTLDEIFYGSADSYAQTRLIYLQNRRFERGQVQAANDADDYFDSYANPARSSDMTFRPSTGRCSPPPRPWRSRRALFSEATFRVDFWVSEASGRPRIFKWSSRAWTSSYRSGRSSRPCSTSAAATSSG